MQTKQSKTWQNPDKLDKTMAKKQNNLISLRVETSGDLRFLEEDDLR
jgi:hypothetical protein